MSGLVLKQVTKSSISASGFEICELSSDLYCPSSSEKSEDVSVNSF